MASSLDGVICNADEVARSRHDASIHCLTRGQSIGLVLAAESGFISLLAVLWVFVIIFRNLKRHVRNHPDSTIWNIMLGPMDIFMLSLFAADFVQALGAVMDIHWINDGKVEIGSFCTAQGVIQQLGETGVAITTLVIAIYTFVGVWWRIGLNSTRAASFVIGIVWTFIILMVAIGNITYRDKHQLYQSPTPYWCWIGQDYMNFRIWGEYIWLWITLVFSFLAYIPLFFWSRGNISVDERSWWRFSLHRSTKVNDPDGHRRASYEMIAYPLVYSILVLPLSIVRWIGFAQEARHGTSDLTSAATIAVITLYGFSGALNVLLLLVTRPASLLFGHARPSQDWRDNETHGDKNRPFGHAEFNSGALATHANRTGIHARPQALTDFGRAPSPVSSLPQSSRDYPISAGETTGNALQLGRLPSISDDGA